MSKQGPGAPKGNKNSLTHGGYSGKGHTRLDGRTRTYRRWKRYRDEMLAQMPEARRIKEEYDVGIMAFCRLKMAQMMEYDLANPKPVGKKGLAPPCGNQFLAYLGHYTRGMGRFKLDGWDEEDLASDLARVAREQGA